VAEIAIIFFWTLTLMLAFEEGKRSADVTATPQTGEEHIDEWLRVQYKIFHSDLQWAKDRSVEAVRFVVLLVAGLVAAHRYYSFGTNVSSTLFVVLIAVTGVTIAWHVYGLHRFATTQRNSYLKILARYPVFSQFVPPRGWDRHHLQHLIAKLAIIAIITWLGIQGVLHVLRPPATQ
jgi:hypothetical protein